MDKGIRIRIYIYRLCRFLDWIEFFTFFSLDYSGERGRGANFIARKNDSTSFLMFL